MTRPIKPPPGFKQHYIFNLLTGRSTRKIYLPPHCAGKLNQVLKKHNCDYLIVHRLPRSGD